MWAGTVRRRTGRASLLSRGKWSKRLIKFAGPHGLEGTSGSLFRVSKNVSTTFTTTCRRGADDTVNFIESSDFGHSVSAGGNRTALITGRLPDHEIQLV